MYSDSLTPSTGVLDQATIESGTSVQPSWLAENVKSPLFQSGSEKLQKLSLWLAGSDWGHDPERHFGHVTVRVDPGEEEEDKEEETPRSRSGLADRDLDNDDYDDDNISGVSGSYEDNDEVPFGPSRAVPGEGKGQSKSLEIFRRATSHASYPDVDIEQGTLSYC